MGTTELVTLHAVSKRSRVHRLQPLAEKCHSAASTKDTVKTGPRNCHCYFPRKDIVKHVACYSTLQKQTRKRQHQGQLRSFSQQLASDPVSSFVSLERRADSVFF